MTSSIKRVGTIGLRRLVLVTIIVVAVVGFTGLWCNEQSAFNHARDNVFITFSVVNRWGRFVSVGRDDLTVYRDQRPQETVEFISESELPLRLALLVDTRNSLREHFGAIQDAAAGFINNALLGDRPDQPCSSASTPSLRPVAALP